MSELQNFPFVNQLNSPTLDGLPDTNRLFNCVPASVCAGLRYLTGDNSFEPDQLKDYAYGEGWVNSGTAASAFVGFCKLHGVNLHPVETDSHEHAVATAHRFLARGLPVIFTQQDDYSSNPDFTHVCVWYKDTLTSLTAMDPFGAKAITFAEETWARRLRSNELWIMEKIAMTTVPQGWHDDGTTLTAPNGIPVKLGFREHVLANNWDPNNFPLELEQGLPELEISNPALGGGTWQPFRWIVLEWTAQRNVAQMWAGQELLATRTLVITLQTQIKSLQVQLTQVQNNADLTAQLNDLKNRLGQINTLSKA